MSILRAMCYKFVTFTSGVRLNLGPPAHTGVRRDLVTMAAAMHPKFSPIAGETVMRTVQGCRYEATWFFTGGRSRSVLAAYCNQHAKDAAERWRTSDGGLPF